MSLLMKFLKRIGGLVVCHRSGQVSGETKSSVTTPFDDVSDVFYPDPAIALYMAGRRIAVRGDEN
jgi:hypothetical protein